MQVINCKAPGKCEAVALTQFIQQNILLTFPTYSVSGPDAGHQECTDHPLPSEV